MMPESRSPIHTATAGASAALFTWAVVLPLDVLRTRVQVVFFVGEGPEGGHFGFWGIADWKGSQTNHLREFLGFCEW